MSEKAEGAGEAVGFPPAARAIQQARALRVAAAALMLLPGAAITLSLIAACLILLRFSFNHWDAVRSMTPGWTLENYAALPAIPSVLRAFVTTLRISAIVTAICIVVGYPVALGIARSRHRALLTFLLVSPMLMDVLIRAYGWIIMLGQRGIVNATLVGLGVLDEPKRFVFTETAVVLELIHELIPFMVLPIAAVIERIDPVYAEAAMNLRAGPVRTFLHVTLPMSVPGVFAGTLLTFALAMSAFVAPLLLGGGNVQTITMLMRQSMLTTLNWPFGSAESVALVVLVLALLVVQGRIIRGLG